MSNILLILSSLLQVLDFLAEEGFIIVEDNEEEVLIDDTQSDPDYVPDYSLETDEEELYPDSEDNLFGDYYDYGEGCIWHEKEGMGMVREEEVRLGWENKMDLALV